MKLNNLITESVLDLKKWHAETTPRTVVYWYFIDVHPTDKIGIYLFREDHLYVSLQDQRHMCEIADRSNPLNKPPLRKLKDPGEKRTAVRRIFSLADKK